LTSEELLELPILYRATLSSPSIARATSLDKALLDHLEAPLDSRLFPRLRRSRDALEPHPPLLPL
jgi:hypothetical protein